MLTHRKFKNDAFEVIHSSASAQHRTDAISDATLREFDKSCRTASEIAPSLSNLRSSRINGVDDATFFDPLTEAELAPLDTPCG